MLNFLLNAYCLGAWIVTGGTHAGVMKHVGNAIHKHNTTKSRKVNKIMLQTQTIVNRSNLMYPRISCSIKLVAA